MSEHFDMHVKYSVFTKPWPTLALKDLAALVADLGFDGVELPVRPGFQVEPASVGIKLREAVATFADRGLRIFSVAAPLDEAVIHACGSCGIPLLRTMAPIHRGAYRASEAKLLHDLSSAAAWAHDAGIAIGVQEHYGDQVSCGVGLCRLLEQVGSTDVGAVWDAAHDALAGQEPESSLDLLWDRLLMVNLKNAFYYRTNGPEADEAAWGRYFTAGRHGLASWPRVINELQRRSFDGVLCLTAEYSAEAETERLTRQDLVYAKALVDAARQSAGSEEP